MFRRALIPAIAALLMVGALDLSTSGRPQGRPSSRPIPISTVQLVDRTPLPHISARVLARQRQNAALVQYARDIEAALRWIAARSDPFPGGVCPASIDREILAVFGAADAPRVLTIIRHESRCNPSAANTFASCDGGGRHWAKGLMQVCLPMHARMYEAVGCVAAQWAEVRCHLRAARELLRVSGWRAWAGAY